jgi:hypothetical protein
MQVEILHFSGCAKFAQPDVGAGSNGSRGGGGISAMKPLLPLFYISICAGGVFPPRACSLAPLGTHPIPHKATQSPLGSPGKPGNIVENDLFISEQVVEPAGKKVRGSDHQRDDSKSDPSFPRRRLGKNPGTQQPHEQGDLLLWHGLLLKNFQEGTRI